MSSNESNSDVVTGAEELYVVVIPYVQEDEGTYSTTVRAMSHDEAALSAAEEMAGDEFDSESDRLEWIRNRAAAVISVEPLKQAVLRDLADLFGDILFPDGAARSINYEALKSVIYENRDKLLGVDVPAPVPERILSYDSANDGFCRLYYRDQNKKLFCFQLSSRNQFELLACDSGGEPSHPISHANMKLGRIPSSDESSMAESFSVWWANQ